MAFDAKPGPAGQDEPGGLYVKREAIHPRAVHGKYRLIKWAVLVVTLGIYYGLPWVRWPRAAQEPAQAVLADFEGGRLYFFALEIWPDEFYLLTGVLVLSALILFAVTAVWGRLWCGFACPQTVWTDLYIAIERMVEGDRNKRLQLAKKPWGPSKLAKKLTKHGLWLVVAAATGGAWVLYFHDAPTVVRGLFTGQAPATSYIFIGILTFTTYALAGLMREQVCTYMCPWPRIQGAMTDAETFQVGYYAKRGEPRGKHKKGADWSGLGDCIDCSACVTVCPMGIDIRDGDQLECINCGLCVDACDEMMKKVGLPTGLIAFGSDYDRVTEPDKRRRFPALIRPRTIVYAVATALVAGLMVFGLAAQESVEFGIERDRATAYVTLSDGRVRNAITARILNKESMPRTYRVSVSGPEALEVAAVGHDVADRAVTFTLAGDKHLNVRMLLTMPEGVRGGTPIDVTLEDLETGQQLRETIGFVGPDGGR